MAAVQGWIMRRFIFSYIRKIRMRRENQRVENGTSSRGGARNIHAALAS